MKKKVYLASNVGMEYFLFLSKVLNKTDFKVKTFFYLSEFEYRLMSRGSLIRRLTLRFKMYLIYPAYLFVCGLRFKKNSIFIVSSGTFYTPYLMQVLLKFKNIKVVQLLYDLYPDILEASEIIKWNSYYSKILGNIARGNQQKCYGTVYLGKFLKEHAERRWGKPRQSSVIDISTDVQLYTDHIPKKYEGEKFIIHYGGQIGQAHDVDSMVECLSIFFKTRLTDFFEFNFSISGSKSSYFRDRVKYFPLKVNHTVKGEEWRQNIKNFHIGLVSLMPVGASICLPSKTYSMMAGGLAIISICPSWSDLAALVKDNHSGWIINNSIEDNLKEFKNINEYKKTIYRVKDRKKIAENFISILGYLKDNPHLIYEKRLNAYNKVRQNYSLKNLTYKWNSFLNVIS